MTKDSSLGFLGISLKKAILTGAGAVLLAGIAIGLLAKAANFHKTFLALAHADIWWFFACLAGETAAYAGYIFAYRDFARASHGPKLRWLDAAQVVGVGIGANILGATAAALAVDYWALSQSGAKTHESARRVLALNIMEWANLSLLAVLAAIALLAGLGKGAPFAMTLFWIIVVPLCFFSAGWFTNPKRVKAYTGLPKVPRRPGLSPSSWATWLWGNVRKGFSDSIGGVAIVRHIMSHPRDYLAGNLGFYLFWIGHAFTLYAATQAFGYNLGPAALMLAYATAYLLTILPLPAGGAGGMEAVLTYTLHLTGMPLHQALASTLAFRFFTFWLPIAPALVLLPTAGSLCRRLSASRRDRQTPRMKHVELLH